MENNSNQWNLKPDGNPVQPTVHYTPSFYVSPYRRRLREIAHEPKSAVAALLTWAASLFSAYLLVYYGSSGAAIPVAFLTLYAIYYFFIGFRGRKKSVNAGVLLLLEAGIAAGYFLNESGIALFVLTAALAVLIPIQLMHSAGLLSDAPVQNTFRVLFSQSFSAMDMPFRSVGGNLRKGKKVSTIGLVLLGLLAAVPIAGILLTLFMRADEMFRSAVRSIFGFPEWDVFLITAFFTLVVGVPAALYFPALFFALRAGDSAEKREAKPFRGVLPSAAVCVFLLIPIAVELLFIFVQFKYLFLHNAALKVGVSFSDYARSGFFEISAASIFTGVLIFLVSALTKRKENGEISLAVRILSTIFAACVCFLLSSAFYRMYNYIAVYSLTVKRLAVCWLMGLMAVMLLGVILKMWVGKLNLPRFLVYTVAVFALAASFFPADCIAAKYNVDRYLEDSAYNLDMEYLEILDAAAVPELQRLYGTDKEERANEILYYFARRDEESRRHLTLSSYRAEKALKAHPPTAPQNSEEERPFDTDDYPEVYETPTEVDEWWMR